MNVFGQVWLWSLLSFVAGAALTWLVMVRPARRQVADLEDQLLDARRSAPPIASVSRDDDFEVDEWDDAPPRSLSDEVLNPPTPAPFPAPAPAPFPAPYVEPPAYFGEPVAPPVVAEEPEPQPEPEPYEPVVEEPVVVQEPVTPVRQYMEPDEAQRRFEEQLAEQRAMAEADEDRPRSLFERLSPEDVPEETPAEMTTVLPRSGLEAADFDDEPELPAEQTGFMPTVAEPTAEVAPPAQEPTAPAEVDEHLDDFIYQPREVWAQQEQEAFLDEAAEQEDEPAHQDFAEPEQLTRSEQTSFIAVEQSSWPANDLTGEYPGLRDEISGQLDGFVEPESPAEQTMVEAIQPIEPADLDAPHVRNGVFETTLAEEHGFTEPEFESEPAHARREPLEPEVFEPEAYEPEVFEPEPVAYAEPEEHEEPAEYRQPVGYVAPFSEPGAPAPAPFSAFGAPPETEMETTGRQPRAVAAAFDHLVEVPEVPAKPEPVADRPRSLFEPLLDADEPLPALGQTRQLPEPTNDEQPFVPTFVPSDEPLLAAPPEPEPEPEPFDVDLPQRTTEAGLPIREARRTTQQRQQSFSAFAAFEQPKQEAPAAPPVPAASRPRPVGFSPSTGGRPNGAAGPGSSRFQQPEGFNPRSPFGPGSVLPKSDGHAPAADFSVKATLTGRRYYSEGSANFGETRADVWFRTEADAEKAGFRPAP
ncbi:MAG: hypothetical protein QOF58_5766 [Pseudonocardiales bacterium]|nr:hypothetical protein [Pseudonocardiales bacterium]